MEQITQSERAAAMAEKYRAGATLQEIADYYGITRERVRQIMKERLGVTGKDGGRMKRAAERRAAITARQDAKYIAKLGMSFADYEAVRKIKDGSGKSPQLCYQTQVSNARARGIEWNLTFAEWWLVWSESGKWKERGVAGYVMARHGDTGPYAVGNVKIISHSENQSEYIRRYWKRVRAGELPPPQRGGAK